jgi:hypothetical protein
MYHAINRSNGPDSIPQSGASHLFFMSEVFSRETSKSRRGGTQRANRQTGKPANGLNRLNRLNGLNGLNRHNRHNHLRCRSNNQVRQGNIFVKEHYFQLTGEPTCISEGESVV